MKYNFEMSKIVNGVNELFYFIFYFPAPQPS